MKIGLTIRNINNFENIQTLCLNGAIPHNRMLYYYLKDKCELYLISDTINKNKNINYIKYDNYNELSKLNIILQVGIYVNYNKIKQINDKIKIILYHMGNIYQMDTYKLLQLDTIYKLN